MLQDASRSSSSEFFCDLDIMHDEALKVLPVKLPRTSAVSVAIVTLKNRTLTPAAETFVKCVREFAKSMAGKPQPQGS